MREHLLATTSSARPLFPRRSAAPPRPPPLSHHLPTTLEGWILSRALAQIAHEIRAGNVLDGRRAARRFGALTRRAAARRAVPARALRRVRVRLRHRWCHREPAGSGGGREHRRLAASLLLNQLPGRLWDLAGLEGGGRGRTCRSPPCGCGRRRRTGRASPLAGARTTVRVASRAVARRARRLCGCVAWPGRRLTGVEFLPARPAPAASCATTP